jgi:hypothetical protein
MRDSARDGSGAPGGRRDGVSRSGHAGRSGGRGTSHERLLERRRRAALDVMLGKTPPR